MAKSRPPAGRPPGRRGKGGVGPGPGYRTTGTGKGTSHNGDCCPMAAAVSSAKKGKWRLAARYARWSARLIAARIA